MPVFSPNHPLEKIRREREAHLAARQSPSPTPAGLPSVNSGQAQPATLHMIDPIPNAQPKTLLPVEGIPQQPARSPGLSVVGGGDRTEAIQTLADQMERERFQRGERRAATRLRQDQQSNARLARFNAGLAAGTSVNPNDPSPLARSAAASAASFQGLADKQSEALKTQGPSSILARQGERNDKLLQNQQQLGIQQQQADAATIGALNRNRNPARQTAFQRELEKSKVANFSEFQNKANQSKLSLSALSRAAGLSEDVAGRFAKPIAFADSILEGLGVTSGNFASKVQQLEGISNQLALANKDALGLTGVLSDSDIRLLQSTTVKAGNTDEANQSIIRAQSAISQGFINEAERQRQFVEQNGTLDGYNPEFNARGALADLELAGNAGLQQRITQAQQSDQNITAENLRFTAEQEGKSVDEILAELGV